MLDTSKVPSTMDLLSQAVSASKSGQPVSADSLGVGRPLATGTGSGDDDDLADTMFTDVDSPLLPTEENAAGDAEKLEATPTTDETVTDTTAQLRTEKIKLSDGSELEIDFSDKAKLTKYIQDSHNYQKGFRKMQVERDSLTAKVKPLEDELREAKKSLDNLDKVYEEAGYEGLIDLIEGRAGASKDWLESQFNRRRFLENASPEQKEALTYRETADKQKREIEKMRKENEDFRKSIETERVEAEKKYHESIINPMFLKYKFDGKVESTEDAEYLNDMLWDKTLAKIEKLPSDTLSETDVEDLFRTEHSRISKLITKQVEKKVTNHIEKKKKEAIESVQATVKSEYDPQGKTREEIQRHLKANNIVGLLSGLNRYGSVLRGNRK